MYIKSMSWISVIALAPAILLASSANYRIALEFVVCWTAAMIVMQSFRAGRYGWAAAFSIMAVLFNPIAPVAVSSPLFRGLVVACLALFAASLSWMKAAAEPEMLSIASQPVDQTR